jgi:predicted amidohydrolase YtcJ
MNTKKFLLPVLLLFLVAILVNLYCQDKSNNEKANFILYNGNVITMEPKMPQATAIAIKGEKILKVGSDEEIKNLAGPKCNKLDLNGKTVIPGLIDAHLHLLSLGQSKRLLNLVGTPNIEIIQKMVESKAAHLPKGTWIIGRGWDQNDWPEKAFPTLQDLDKVAPDNPVWLTRIDGHAGWANSKALEIAQVTKDTADPSGGKIHRDSETGEPTGIFIDAAEGLIAKHIPPSTYNEKKMDALNAIRACLTVGLTGIHDASVDAETIKIYKKLIDEERFNFRVYVMIRGESEAAKQYLKKGPEIGYGNNRLTIRSFKLFSDGALGSRGAAFFKPYSDDPSNTGLITFDPDKAYALMVAALKNHFQVNTHCIGIKGNSLVLDLYGKALKEVPVKDHRFRIEHAQIVRPSDIKRFKKLGVIASMQPTHCTSDMYWAEDRVGPERIKGAYAWRSFLDEGVKIAGGSDAPVESENPFFGIYAAITRQDQKGYPEGGWHPEQRLTREEALRIFTIDAAYAAFEEGIKGSLKEGKLADLVIIDEDIMTIPVQMIFKIRPRMTILGGKIVHRRG